MKDVAADGEVEATISGLQPEHTLVLEGQPGREFPVARSRKFEVGIDDVDSEHTSSWKELGQRRGDLPRAASCIEDAGLDWKCVAANQQDFLRPDCPRLASKPRTIDSSAICLACGLRSVMALS